LLETFPSLGLGKTTTHAAVRSELFIAAEKEKSAVMREVTKLFTLFSSSQTQESKIEPGATLNLNKRFGE
jgi:hypothetical protein